MTKETFKKEIKRLLEKGHLLERGSAQHRFYLQFVKEMGEHDPKVGAWMGDLYEGEIALREYLEFKTEKAK